MIENKLRQKLDVLHKALIDFGFELDKVEEANWARKRYHEAPGNDTALLEIIAEEENMISRALARIRRAFAIYGEPNDPTQ